MFPLCYSLLVIPLVLRISTLPIEYTANLKLWRIIPGLAELAPRHTGYTGGNDRENDEACNYTYKNETRL